MSTRRAGGISSLVALVFVAQLFCIDAADARRRRRRMRKGILEIESMTSGAQAFLDGKLWGTLPIKPLRLRPGSYRLTVRKLGHLEYSNTVKIRRGQTTSLMVDLLPVAAVLSVRSNAPDAVLYVNDRKKGELPQKIELKAGTYQVTVRAPGFIPYKKEITLADLGTEEELYAKLAVDELAGGVDDSAVPALALEPVPESGSEGDSPSGDADDPLALEPLALEPLPEDEAADDGSQDRNGDTLLLAAPVQGASSAATTPPAGASAERKWGQGPEWWNEWWVWTIAGAVIIGSGVTTGVLVAGGSGDDVVAGKDGHWVLGSSTLQ